MGIFGFSFLGIGFCKMIMEIYRKRELIGWGEGNRCTDLTQLEQ
jgi:hypothetical protein